MQYINTRGDNLEIAAVGQNVKKTFKKHGALITVIILGGVGILLLKSRNNGQTQVYDTTDPDSADLYAYNGAHASYPDAVTNADTIISTMQNSIDYQTEQIRNMLGENNDSIFDYMGTNFDSLNNKIDATNDYINDGLDKTNELIKQENEQLRGDISNQLDNLASTNNSRFDAITNNIGNLSDNINEYKNQVNDMASNVSGIQSAIGGMQSKLDKFNTNYNPITSYNPSSGGGSNSSTITNMYGASQAGNDANNTFSQAQIDSLKNHATNQHNSSNNTAMPSVSKSDVQNLHATGTSGSIKSPSKPSNTLTGQAQTNKPLTGTSNFNTNALRAEIRK